MKHVGFLIRLVAYIIDAIIISIGSWVISAIFGMSSWTNMSSGMQQVSFSGLQLVGLIIQIIWGVGYLLYFWSTTGQTPGKMIMGIKIVPVGGGRMTLGKAILRWIGYFVSAIVFCLGFLWIIWDKEKQGWHDKIAGTYVVKA